MGVNRMMLAAFILFFAMMALKVGADVKLYQLRKVNKHVLGPALVLLGLIACSILAGWVSTPMWFFCWWVLFDGVYNLFIGQRWTFIGTTAKLDILQRKHPVLVWVKYLGAVLSVILFIWQN